MPCLPINTFMNLRVHATSLYIVRTHRVLWVSRQSFLAIKRVALTPKAAHAERFSEGINVFLRHHFNKGKLQRFLFLRKLSTDRRGKQLFHKQNMLCYGFSSAAFRV